jgi:hypothetical protein
MVAMTLLVLAIVFAFVLVETPVSVVVSPAIVVAIPVGSTVVVAMPPVPARLVIVTVSEREER